MKNVKPFDTKRRPLKPQAYLMPIEWGGTVWFLAPVGGKINKVNCEGLKPPYLVLQNHASFVDFPMLVKAMFPRSAGWVISVEEFIGREFLMRGIGGIYKRKFTQDLGVVKHILTMLTRMKKSCVIYPEARFSFVGINEEIDGALGKLAKKSKCPIVVFIQHGNFLRSPQWCKHPYRRVKVSGDFIQVASREEVMELPASELQRRIEEAFQYDDYAWQYENKIRITSPMRAHNIHKVLYQCPICGREFSMESQGTRLWCSHCGESWEMDEYGRLHRENGEDIFSHVPDWYNWQRQQVRAQVDSGSYAFEDEAELYHMVNAQKGFRKIGDVRLMHNEEGFTLSGRLHKGEEFYLNRPVNTMRSVHVEFDFKKRGIPRPMDGIDLASHDDTWFVFPKNAKNVLTKLHFATEELNKARVEEKAR